MAAFQPEASGMTEVNKKGVRRHQNLCPGQEGNDLIGSALWSHLGPKEIALASSNLALVTGHMGKASCGILILLENAMIKEP